MKKRIMSILSSTVLLVGMISGSVLGADVAKQPLSAPPGFIQEAPTRGEMVILARGEYLRTGFCDLEKAGVGKLLIKGETLAVGAVSEVRINISINQWNANTQGWSQYQFVSKSNYNTNAVDINQIVDVPRGYYYRLSTTHYANSDVGNSYSGQIWIG